MTQTKCLLIIGTRPEAIKMAPVARECSNRSGQIETFVCVTGQHREMLQQVTDYFGIKADEQLGLMMTDQSLARLTSRCIEGIDSTLQRLRPDYVVAQGDTTTVMAASLAAFYRKTSFVHVEAGLRTGNLNSPWPEELNRRIATLATLLHCAPTQRSFQNLVDEGVSDERIRITGNTVIDALLQTVQRERANSDRWRDKYPELGDRRLVLITGHRRESFGTGFDSICRAIASLSDRFPDIEFLYPVHLNPNVQKPVRQILVNRKNVHLHHPVSYPEFVWLMDRSTLILTDSGGVQEEAPSLRKPVLVMRETTERPEAVHAGAAELVGTSHESIVTAVTRLLTDEIEYTKRQIDRNPYGDGTASRNIVDFIQEDATHSS